MANTPCLLTDNKTFISEREREILQLLYEGLNSKQIGVRLYISHRTVEDYRQKLMKKVGANNVAGLIRFGIKNELIKI